MFSARYKNWHVLYRLLLNTMLCIIHFLLFMILFFIHFPWVILENIRPGLFLCFCGYLAVTCALCFLKSYFCVKFCFPIYYKIVSFCISYSDIPGFCVICFNHFLPPPPNCQFCKSIRFICKTDFSKTLSNPMFTH